MTFSISCSLIILLVLVLGLQRHSVQSFVVPSSRLLILQYHPFNKTEAAEAFENNDLVDISFKDFNKRGWEKASTDSYFWFTQRASELGTHYKAASCNDKLPGLGDNAPNIPCNAALALAAVGGAIASLDENSTGEGQELPRKTLVGNAAYWQNHPDLETLHSTMDHYLGPYRKKVIYSAVVTEPWEQQDTAHNNDDVLYHWVINQSDYLVATSARSSHLDAALNSYVGYVTGDGHGVQQGQFASYSLAPKDGMSPIINDLKNLTHDLLQMLENKLWGSFHHCNSTVCSWEAPKACLALGGSANINEAQILNGEIYLNSFGPMDDLCLV